MKKTFIYASVEDLNYSVKGGRVPKIVMKISKEDTQKKLDKALKRNLEAQQVPKAEPKTAETTEIAE